MGGSVVASSVWTSGVSWVSWPSRLPKGHRHQTQILKEQQKSQSQTAQMPSTGQACREARAMGQEASSPHCLHTTSTQRLPPAAESSPITQRGESQDLGARSCRPFLGRRCFDGICHCCVGRLVCNRAGSESTHLCWSPERGFPSSRSTARWLGAGRAKRE